MRVVGSLRLSTVTAVGALLLAACTSGPTDGDLASPPGNSSTAQLDPGSIPLLEPGQHLGFKSFVDLPPERQADLEARTKEAIDAGMDIGRVFYDWVELEPELDTYELEDLRSDLATMRESGLAPMVGILVGGSEGYAVPAEFQDPDDNARLAAGVSIDSPDVIKHFEALLDRILPELMEAGTWSLQLMNEPDGILTDLADQGLEDEGRNQAEAMASFIGTIRDHVRAVEPGLPISFTMSYFSMYEPPEGLALLVEPTDILTVNYGCLDPATFEVTRIGDIPAEIATFLGIAGTREVVIQELSCGSGWESQPSDVGTTDEFQRDWFEAFYAEMARQPRIRASFVLDTVDWPPSYGKLFTDSLREEGLEEIADKYEEFLTTWGLLRYPDLAPKPSWHAFVEAVRRTSGATPP